MNLETLNRLSGTDVSRETFARLDAFVGDFLAWSKRINLIAPSTIDEVWQRHVVDSLQLLALAPNSKHWIDLGSGGGFPGLVVAIALADDNDSRVTLVESNRKKTAFLRVMKGKYAPRTEIIDHRIEDALPVLPPPDIITARALADLDQLLTWTHLKLAEGSVGFFMKGRGYEGEIENSHANWSFDLVEHMSRTASDAVVLQISNVKPARSV